MNAANPTDFDPAIPDIRADPLKAFCLMGVVYDEAARQERPPPRTRVIIITTAAAFRKVLRGRTVRVVPAGHEETSVPTTHAAAVELFRSKGELEVVVDDNHPAGKTVLI